MPLSIMFFIIFLKNLRYLIKKIVLFQNFGNLPYLSIQNFDAAKQFKSNKKRVIKIELWIFLLLRT